MMLNVLILLLFINVTLCFNRLSSRYIPRSYELYAKDIKKVGKDQTRVRLLIDVKDIGKKGQIVLVSNGMFMNSLGPKRCAEKVSDDEMKKLEETEDSKNKDELDNAIKIQNEIKQMSILTLTKKKGKDEQLFGAVTTKMVIEELKSKFGNDTTLSSNNKNLMVTQMIPKTVNGQLLGGDLINNEIRRAGSYSVELKLHPKVSISFDLNVNSE